jgi:hypothetical protein
MVTTLLNAINALAHEYEAYGQFLLPESSSRKLARRPGGDDS